MRPFFINLPGQESGSVYAPDTGNSFNVAFAGQSNARSNTGVGNFSEYTFLNNVYFFDDKDTDEYILYNSDKIIGDFIRSFHPSTDGHALPGFAHYWRQLKGDVVTGFPAGRGGAPLMMKSFGNLTSNGVWSVDYDNSDITKAHFFNLKNTISAAINVVGIAGGATVDRCHAVVWYQGEGDNTVIKFQWTDPTNPNVAVNTNYGGGSPPSDVSGVLASSVYKSEMINLITTSRTDLTTLYPSLSAHYSQMPWVIVKTSARQSQIDAYNQYLIDTTPTDLYYAYLANEEIRKAQQEVADENTNVYIITATDNFPDPLPGGAAGGGHYHDDEIHYSIYAHDNLIAPQIANILHSHYYG